MKIRVFCVPILCFFLVWSFDLTAQENRSTIPAKAKWSERMALSIMKTYPKAWQIDHHEAPKWDYKIGMILTAYEKLYSTTANQKYLNYISEYADAFIDDSGTFQNFDANDHNIDFINAGKILFGLYDTTHQQKYLRALKIVRKQFDSHPRTPSGGFWHKKIYPNQMWLDGLYMGQPFYARYTTTFENGMQLNDVAYQFELLHDHTLDSTTGLFFHAYDESRQMPWANKKTGTAPHIWLRALGWYGMALVDVLDYFPIDHPKRKVLINYLNELTIAVKQYQDPSGLWYQIPNLPNGKGNYLEASGSAMLVYAIAKGVHKGYLPNQFENVALKGFDGLLSKLIQVDQEGLVHITQVCKSAGLGGNPYRDGSYDYYMSEKVVTDNSHGLGAFLLAAIELNK
ncbi:MAG: hypothetical protein RLZZ44_624 [Bacteroidota bacterium]